MYTLGIIVNAPRQLADGAPFHIQTRFQNVRVNGYYCYKWHFVEHHLAHAASAFLPSSFDSAAVMTLDGRGELATTAYFNGQGSRMEPLGQVEMPHSLGILYEQLTEYLGFLHSSDEYKVMALASFGEPRFLEEFREIVQVQECGRTGGGRYTVRQPLDLVKLFGPARQKGDPLEQRHFDSAHFEPVGQCNLRCQMCPILYRQDGPPYGPPAFMDFELFTRLVDGFGSLETLHLQGLGEPMMHTSVMTAGRCPAAWSPHLTGRISGAWPSLMWRQSGMEPVPGIPGAPVLRHAAGYLCGLFDLSRNLLIYGISLRDKNGHG